MVNISEEDHGALVKLVSTCGLAKNIGDEITMFNQSRVRMKIERLERLQYNHMIEIVEEGSVLDIPREVELVRHQPKVDDNRIVRNPTLAHGFI